MTNSEMDLNPLVDELYAALEQQVPRETLIAELEKYLIQYKTGPSVAKDSILRKYRAPKTSGTFASSAPVTKKIGDLEGTEISVNVVARVVFVEKKEITVKGIARTITSGILGDDTGTAPFTIWRDDADLDKGTVYTFKGAYTKKFRDQVQINLGTRGKVEPNNDVTFDVPAQSAAASVTKKINEITGTETSVDLVAKAVYVEKREVTIRGSPTTIISGILGDDTGTISFTAWRDDIEMEKGNVYSVKNAYAKTFNEKPQLNVGTRGSIEPNSEVTFDVPASSASSPAELLKIRDITENTRNLDLVACVSELDSRQIVIKGETKTVFGGMLSDETGKIQFTDWADHNLSNGDTITIKNAYIRSWKGIPQVNIGDRSEVCPSETKIEAVAAGPCKKTVEEVLKVGGGLDLSITGTVVDVRSGSGLIKRCPKCRRAIVGDTCSVDGHVEDPVMDLRLKLTLDDGTGAISAILGRADTEMVTGITLDEAVEAAKEKGDMGVVGNTMARSCLLKKLTVTGNIMSDEYGPQMSVRHTELETYDTHAEAEALLENVEASL